MSSSSSGNGGPSFALLTGDASANPDVVASFRLGDNSMRPDGVPEFALGDASEDWAGAAGHLTWDASHDANGDGDRDGAFFSVAPVRLRVERQAVRWSVGTADFIVRAPRPFRRIRKVQVVAATAVVPSDCVVQWDFLEVRFCDADADPTAAAGARRHASPCLPRASSRAGLRRSPLAGGPTAPGLLQQYAEIIGPPQADRFELRGQVTLRADRGVRSLPVDALRGQVLIFTE